jgi:tetratricopeptide (TPR) repeat protein
MRNKAPAPRTVILTGLVVCLGIFTKAAPASPPNPTTAAAFCMGIQSIEERRYEDAVYWLEKTLESDPQALQAHIWIGMVCAERLKRPVKARKHFEAALKIAPDNFRVRFGLARMLIGGDDPEKARDAMLAVLQAPEAKRHTTLVLQAYRELARDAERRNDTERAAEYYNAAALVAPQPNMFLLRLVNLYRRTQQHDKTVATLLRVQKLSPSNARIHLELANTYKVMGRWEDALRELKAFMEHAQGPGEQTHLLREAADLAARARRVEAARTYQEKLLLHLLKIYTPDKAAPRLCEEIADTLAGLGRHAQAEPYLVKAIEADHGQTQSALRLKLAKIYRKLNRTDDAIDQINQALALVPKQKSIRFHTELCAVYEASKRYEEAEKALKAILDIPGSKAAGHAELGLFYERRGQVDQAVEALREAIKLADTPASIRFTVELSSVYTNAKRFQEAEHLLTEAVKLHPDNPALNNAMAWFYADRNMKLDQALELVGKALKVSPNNAYYLDTLGWIYFRQGKHDKALEQLLRAVALVEDSRFYDHLGEVYLALEKPQDALMHWRRAAKLDPTLPGIQEKLKKIEASDPTTP